MIAERAGISPRTFFNHWATKEAALLGVVFTDADGIGDALRARPAEEAPTVALRAVLPQLGVGGDHPHPLPQHRAQRHGGRLLGRARCCGSGCGWSPPTPRCGSCASR